MPAVLIFIQGIIPIDLSLEPKRFSRVRFPTDAISNARVNYCRLTVATILTWTTGKYLQLNDLRIDKQSSFS